MGSTQSDRGKIKRINPTVRNSESHSAVRPRYWDVSKSVCPTICYCRRADRHSNIRGGRRGGSGEDEHKGGGEYL